MDDNDTSAGDHGSRSGVRGMLQQERMLQGIRRLCQAVLHIPAHAGGGEIIKPWQSLCKAGMPCMACGGYAPFKGLYIDIAAMGQGWETWLWTLPVEITGDWRNAVYEKIEGFINRLGEKLFPDMPEKKRQRIAAQIIVGLFLALICAAGVGIFRHKAAKQLESYQKIAETYAQLDALLEEEKEKSQQEAEKELREMFSEMEADAERYQQEYDTELKGKGLEAYDWNALYSENEDVRGWLCIPGTLVDSPVVGTDDNTFYITHDFAVDKSNAGCPFMDKDSQVWDFNRVIYGYSMGAGSDAVFSGIVVA